MKFQLAGGGNGINIVVHFSLHELCMKNRTRKNKEVCGFHDFMLLQNVKQMQNTKQQSVDFQNNALSIVTR